MSGMFNTTAGRRAAVFVLTAAAYFACADAAYAFAIRPSGVAAMWVPSGLMLALLVAGHRRDWAVTLAGGFVGNVAADLEHHIALPQTVLGGAANSIEVLVAAAVIVRLLRGPLELTSLRQVGVLVLGAVGASNAVTALLGAAAIAQGGGSGYWRGWFVWWAGDGIGMLVVAPAILTALAFIRSRPAFRWRAVVEAVCLSAAVAALAQFVMSQPRDASRIADADPYMIFPLLFWAALRFGPIGAASATLGVAAITVWNAAQGRGPFAQAGYTATNEVLQTYAFLTLMALSSMIVSSVIAERRTAEADAIDRSRHANLAADVATAVSERGPLGDVLGRCAGVIVRRLEAIQVCIWTVSQSEPVLEVQACAGLLESSSGHERIAIGSSVVGEIARDGQPRALDRRGLEAAVGRLALPDQGRGSFLGLPLKLNDRVLGVIGIIGRQPFSERTIETLSSAARTLALGIEGQRLEESRSNLVEILEATPDFVTISPLDGSPVYINAAGRHALGIAEGERIDSLLTYRPQEFSEQLNRAIVPATQRDGTWRGETEYVSRTGRIIPVSQVSIGHKDAAGNVRLLSTISRDITDRLVEQRRLRDAEERLRFALEASGVGVWEVNMQTGVAYWSETCEAMHGMAAGTFGGSMDSFMGCIYEDDRQGVLSAIERAIRDRRDASLEYRTVWPDGRVREISSTGRFVCREDGVPLRGAGIAMDITERRSLEAQLHQAQKMEAIGQLAGGIAHDFNNLITAILGYAALLSDSLGASDARRADVQEIERAAGRAADLTRQLLAFSRKQILQPRVLQLGRVVTDLIPMLRRLLGETIDLRTVIADRGSVKADLGQMEQVLVNIAVNARDAMPSGGCLTIETGDIGADDPRVFLAVRDTGHGMDIATQQRVFEPFFTTKPKGQGTGLGLATVHGIVTQSGGSIDVSSAVGRGTTFRIVLPKTEEPPDYPAIAQEELPAPSGTEMILLVEDEQVVREFVYRVLTRSGYGVHAFVEPKRAVAFSQAHQSAIDLVLTDVVLPGIDGRTMAREILAGHPEAKVLYMSGYTDTAIVDHGVLEPGMWFIQKPFTASALLRKLRELLDHRGRELVAGPL